MFSRPRFTTSDNPSLEFAVDHRHSVGLKPTLSVEPFLRYRVTECAVPQRMHSFNSPLRRHAGASDTPQVTDTQRAHFNSVPCQSTHMARGILTGADPHTSVSEKLGDAR